MSSYSALKLAMTARTLHAVILVLGLGLARTATACSCAPIEDETARFDDLFTRADAIVHARVTGLLKDNEARIELIESFKGRPTTLKAQTGDEGMCGTRFQIGQEAVFVLYRGQVSACGRMPASRKLIERLRAHKR